MAAGADVPHDLATFVIEEALGIEHGFWGCVAEGATFRSLGRRRTEPGRAVIRRRRDELDAAEKQVNREYATWRGGGASPAGSALDEMCQRWRELGEDDAIVLEWVPARGRRDAGAPGHDEQRTAGARR